jgi:hypothetical protein
MRHIQPYTSFLTESIRAAEAHRDEDALQTVIDGKRSIGFITVKTSTMPEDRIWNLIEEHGLKAVEVAGNKYEAYIYYRPGAEAQALELKAIAEKYGGYLIWNATEEDSRRIGELLEYAPEDIEAYITKNYRHATH